MLNPAINAAMISLDEQKRRKQVAAEAKVKFFADALRNGEISVTLTAEDIAQILENRAPDGSIVLKLHMD